jgi:hypothetical protein
MAGAAIEETLEPDRPSERRQRGEATACLVAVLCVLAVAIALFWFAQPLADDFSRAYKGRVQGTLAATRFEYFNWTGRWASSGLNYFLTSSFDLVRAYPFLLLISPTLLAICTYTLLHAADIGRSSRQRLALTASLVAIYWAGMPHPGESFYWLTGNTDNLAGLSLSLLVIAGILRFRPRSAPVTAAITAGLCALALVAAGFHELFALLLCLLLAGGTLAAWLETDRRRWVCTACLVAAIVGFLIVYLAPGNAVRRADFPLAANVAATAELTVEQAVLNAVPWLLDIRLLSASALALMLLPSAMALPPGAQPPTRRGTIILAVTWLAAGLAAFVAASWVIGMEMPARTRNGIYLVFLLGWFWLLVALFRLSLDTDRPLLLATPLMRRIAVGLFVISMLLTGNTWKGVRDLPRSAPAYRDALRARDRTLRAAAARGEQDVTVAPLYVRPQSYITYFEVTDDPEHWENWSVAHYYGLRTVVLQR